MMVKVSIACVLLVLACAGTSNHVLSSTRTPAIVKRIHIDQSRQKESRYYYVPFEVPASCRKININYDYDRANGQNTIDIGLFDSRSTGRFGELNGFRGWSGGRRSEFFVSEDAATPGYVPEKMRAGTWRIILGLYRIAPAGVDITLKIDLETNENQTTRLDTALPSSKISTADSLATRSAEPQTTLPARGPFVPRFVSGDLHMHTVHSDGDWTIPELVAAAANAGLDFICITDHNTNSHHAEIENFKTDGKRPLVLRGEEITTYGGHANAWGLPKNGLIDFRVQPGDQTAMSRVVAQAHQRGALISINHPFAVCGGCAWGYDPEARAFDAIEVWNGSWDSSDELALSLWDRLLQKGRRITAIASSDSHRAANPIGQAATRVAIAGSLSQEAVLKSIRAGRAYLTVSSRAPVVTFAAQTTSPTTYSIGDVIRLNGSHRVHFKITVADLPYPASISLISDGRIVRSSQSDSNKKSEDVEVDVDHDTYFRVEVRDRNGAMLALTNPIFVVIRTPR